ncbi:methyltransferase [Fusarium heterosporum]|uniref:Methyltransferase n=1 Tax=Fusarium heterosporum TaxID=42747 RepID=A0A8H5TQR7_FUSHE|nr:methyltransferase [Fusarium heterosporum]
MKVSLSPYARDGTVPLDETFTEVIEHCGRTYQHYALTNGTYFAPVDEDEISRLEVMHGVLNCLFDERLVFPPIRSPRRILDCGCGSGDWAMEVATQYPDAEVLGIDVSPHMIPENPPDNMELQVDDLNGRFTFPSNHFDLVHSQMMAGGIHANRWRSYIRDIFQVLKPGDHALSQWSRQYLDSQQPYKDLRAPLHLASWMRSAGFTEVESRLLTLPMCGWSNVPREYEMGWSNSDNVSQLLYSLALYPFTQFLGMSLTDFQLLVAQARSEASNPAFKVYHPRFSFVRKLDLAQET